jgi:hypothetical protein
MNRAWLLTPALLALLPSGCSDDPPPARPVVTTHNAQNKKTPIGKNIFFEVDSQTGQRRVIVSSFVALREGQLEGFLTRKGTKTHEYILATDSDAEDIHKALLAAGAEAGSPVTFGPGDKYTPANGSVIKISAQYVKDGKLVTVPAQQWIRNAITKKVLEHKWVFGGSRLIPDPEDEKKKPFYGANEGDFICVLNMPLAMLDLPVKNPNTDPEIGSRVFEANTEKIPQRGTRVDVILEVAAPKKEPANDKSETETKDPPKRLPAGEPDGPRKQ